ncbi:DUF1284 domain-containing protein [Labrys wisconsinensis]|uniref:DUF1284 domain-containing protein n=1 Tax=Labrys wisconsinensis TaxID=425677 RepID=A0ABU0JKM9_9HYPH|nr:DUF1284 domain-containing protein [Labrys wisconsinensis]MDQ0474847.1 hypothetical protein [Labrys wisconsinensis]
MTVRLRGHHLLCMLTYAGRGYTPAFCDNYDRIVERLGAGEDILLVAGPDDVCAPLLREAAPHCHLDRVTRRDALALAASAEILRRPLAPGEVLSLDPALLDTLRAAFAAGTSRAACADCEWADLCTRLAAAGFAGTRLQAS